MSVTLTLVIVVAFSFVAGEALRRLAEWRHVILSGAEYALIGILVGPLALDMLSAEVLHVLERGVWLLLGLVGFTLGLRLKGLRGLTARRAVGGLLVGALSTALVAGSTAGVLFLSTGGYAGFDAGSFTVAMVVLGSAGSVASARLHRSLVDRLDCRGPLIETLEVSAVMSAALGIVVAGLMLDWQRAVDSPMIYESLSLPKEVWLAMGLIVGVVCGLLFVLFQRGEQSDERTFLATIGVVIFASGIAAALGSSPLLVGLVAGVTVSFALPQAQELGAQLQQIEQPVSIALMLFAGALFVPVSGAFLLLPVAYVVARALSVALWPRLVLTPLLPPGLSRYAPQGMRSQGTIPIAIGVSLGLAHPDLAPATNAILIGVLVFEFGAGNALRRSLANAGELGRVPAQELAS